MLYFIENNNIFFNIFSIIASYIPSHSYNNLTKIKTLNKSFYNKTFIVPENTTFSLLLCFYCCNTNIFKYIGNSSLYLSLNYRYIYNLYKYLNNKDIDIITIQKKINNYDSTELKLNKYIINKLILKKKKFHVLIKEITNLLYNINVHRINFINFNKSYKNKEIFDINEIHNFLSFFNKKVLQLRLTYSNFDGNLNYPNVKIMHIDASYISKNMLINKSYLNTLRLEYHKTENDETLYEAIRNLPNLKIFQRVYSPSLINNVNMNCEYNIYSASYYTDILNLQYKIKINKDIFDYYILLYGLNKLLNIINVNTIDNLNKLDEYIKNGKCIKLIINHLKNIKVKNFIMSTPILKIDTITFIAFLYKNGEYVIEYKTINTPKLRTSSLDNYIAQSHIISAFFDMSYLNLQTYYFDDFF